MATCSPTISSNTCGRSGTCPASPLLWAALLADPGPLEDRLRLAREAEERHLYRDAVTLCASPANQGSPGAAMAIGVLLSRLGRHDESDPWVQRAADLGHEGAIRSLASGYMWDATSGQELQRTRPTPSGAYDSSSRTLTTSTPWSGSCTCSRTAGAVRKPAAC